LPSPKHRRCSQAATPQRILNDHRKRLPTPSSRESADLTARLQRLSSPSRTEPSPHRAAVDTADVNAGRAAWDGHNPGLTMREPPPGRCFSPDRPRLLRIATPRSVRWALAICLRSASMGTRVRDANHVDESPQRSQRGQSLNNTPRPHDECGLRVSARIVGRETALIIGSRVTLPVPDAHAMLAKGIP
jgi:hypothetical protein